MQLIVAAAPLRAIRGPQGPLCTVGASGLGTISVGTSLTEVTSLLGALGDQCSVVTFTGTTTERNYVWASSPKLFGGPPRGVAFYDSTLSTQLFGDGISATGWSSTASAGVG